MLVLTRRTGEDIVIDGTIRITVLETRGHAVRIGIVAPESMRIMRKELLDRVSESAAPIVSPARDSFDLAESKIMSRLIHIAR